MKQKPSRRAEPSRFRAERHPNLAKAFEYRSKRFGNRTADIKAQIVELMEATDMTYEEIGEVVGISTMTVYQHVQRMVHLQSQLGLDIPDAEWKQMQEAELAASDLRSQEEQAAKIRANRPRLKP